MYDPRPVIAAFFCAVRINARDAGVHYFASVNTRKNEREIEKRGGGRNYSRHKQTDDDWTISYAVAGVVPSFVGNHSINHLPRFSPYLMAAVAHLARGMWILAKYCRAAASIDQQPPSRIIRAGIRAPINRAARNLCARYATYNCRNTRGWNASYEGAGMFTISLREVKALHTGDSEIDRRITKE